MATITDLLFYDPSNRTGEFYKSDGQGGIIRLRKHETWRRSWKQIISGNFGGSRFTDLLFYDPADGSGEFYTTDGQGQISVLKKHTNWRRGWTHIIPGNFGGDVSFTDLLFYDPAARFGEFYTTDGQGQISILKKHTNWRRGWTHIIPGNFGSVGSSGRTDLLFYDAGSGLGEFYTTDGQGGIALLRRHEDWPTNWTHIIPGFFGGNSSTDLLFYDASSGIGEFYATDSQGGINLLRRHTDWPANLRLIIGGDFRGGTETFTNLLFYDPSNRTGEFYTTDGEGGVALLRRNAGWRRTWSLIVSGSFGDL